MYAWIEHVNETMSGFTPPRKRLGDRQVNGDCEHIRYGAFETSCLWLLDPSAALSMLIVIADFHDDPLELVGRRDRFCCETFTQSIASDQVRGILVLEPKTRTLRVSHSREDYYRVRIFSDSGALLGTMACVANGAVDWSAPTRLPSGRLPREPQR